MLEKKKKNRILPFLNLIITFINREVKHFKQICHMKSVVILKFTEISEISLRPVTMMHFNS